MVKVALDESDSARPDSKPVRKAVPRKKSRWFLKLGVFGSLLFIAAPSLLTVSGFAPKLLQKIHPRLSSAISFSRLTLHWWAPVDLMNVKVKDLSSTAANDPEAISSAPLLCSVERVTTSEPLWRIAMNMGRGTGLVLKSPRLLLVADESGTNIDRTVTAIFGESKSTEENRFPVRIFIENGEVQLSSAAALGSLETDAPSFSDGVEGLVDGLAGTSAGSEPVLSESAESQVTPISAEVSEINGTFSTMDTERWLPEMKLTAKIDRKETAVSGLKVRRPSTQVAARLDDVVGDFSALPLNELTGEIAGVDSSRIQIHLKPRADEKGRQTIQIGAEGVDLRLVQPFLSMMGVEVSCDGVLSGGIDARIAGAALSDGLVGRVLLQGEKVRIRQHGWATDEWLELGDVDASGAIAVADDGMLLQDLQIKSAVAQLTGSGELRHSNGISNNRDVPNQQVEVRGSVDLAAAASSLRRTLAIHDDVTIRTGQLVFQLDASALNSAADSRGLARGQWTAAARIDDLTAVRAGIPLRVDSKTQLDAVGEFSDAIPVLTRARLTAYFGTIDCAPDGAAWKLSGLIQPGSLWQQLRQFADIPEPGLRGDVSFQSRIAMTGETIQLTDLQMNSSDVKASSLALAIRPANPVTSMLDGTIHVEGTGAALRTLLTPWHDASWLADRSRVLADLTASPTKQIEVSVKIAPENLASIPRAGVRSVSQSVSAVSVRPASAAMNSSFSIDEADLRLSMLARDAGQRFDIESGEIRLPGLTSLITGSVSVPEQDLLIDLTADTTYDLDVLSRRIFSSDSGIRLSGQGKDQFRLQGSPSALSGTVLNGSSAGATAAGSGTGSLTGSGAVTWESADAFGLRFSAGSLKATLENQLLRTAPIQCSVNGGELNVVSQYDMATSRLQLGTGSRVQNLQITPDLCRTWLGYVTPMMADTADIEGEVSARVDRFLWDFEQPQYSDVQAQLTIHRAQASPGSSLSTMLEMVSLLRRKEGSADLSQRSLVLPQQTIPVTVRQGAVYHDGLVMELNGYRLSTTGAVGLNKQIQMTIDVPLEKSTADVAGRSIKVPLRGTISSPQPDTAGLLQNLGTQQIQQKIGTEVDKSINRQLNKLFDKF